MTLAATPPLSSPPPMAWYGSSFAYYDDEPEPPTEAQLDEAAERARALRLETFTPDRLGRRPGDGGAEGPGVVLGRFLPVHEGHRFLIELALAHTAEVHVFVRVGPDDPIPFEVRRSWLAELFPAVTVHSVVDGARGFESWVETIRAACSPAYLFAGESYGSHVAGRLGARHVGVDRLAIPVSGTGVREDPWTFERYLPPPVRAWYARRVVILGAESTGKTTLAQQLATHYGTVWVPEHLRSAGDIALAAHGQLAATELLARRATRVLFSDTGLLSVRLWSERLYGTSAEWVRAAAEAETADLYLLTAPDLPFTGEEHRNQPAERRDFHAACERELRRLGKSYVPISGVDRFAAAVTAVDAMLG